MMEGIVDMVKPPNKTGHDQKNEVVGSRKKGRLRRRIWILAGITTVVIGMAMVAGQHFLIHKSVQRSFYQSNKVPSSNRISSLVTGAVTSFVGQIGPENILLIGNNARNPDSPIGIGTGGGQADIMMLAHVEPANHHVVLISIPRNTLFAQPLFNNPIPKLKTLFFIGAQMHPNQAAQLTVKGVSQLTGMPIQHYVVTDFQGFVDAINAMGGIRIKVQGRLYDPMHSGANLFSGWQTLNGNQALAFIRIRQNAASNTIRVNDFQRMDAEVHVLEAMKNKLLNVGNDLTHLNKLVGTWSKDVVTDMTTKQLLQLAIAIHGAEMQHVRIGKISDSMQLTSTALPRVNKRNYITGAYYEIISTKDVYRVLKPYGSHGSSTGLPVLPDPAIVKVQVYGSQNYVNKLKAAGFNVQWMGTGRGTYPVHIGYPNGRPAWGWQVARSLETGNSIVSSSSPKLGTVIVYG